MYYNILLTENYIYNGWEYYFVQFELKEIQRRKEEEERKRQEELAKQAAQAKAEAAEKAAYVLH